MNPGSVGQPKGGNPRAAYAIWEDGQVTLRCASYDVAQTMRAYRGTRLAPHIVKVLAEVLRTGGHLPFGQSREGSDPTFRMKDYDSSQRNS